MERHPGTRDTGSLRCPDLKGAVIIYKLERKPQLGETTARQDMWVQWGNSATISLGSKQGGS